MRRADVAYVQWAIIVIIVAVIAVYFFRIDRNPPGYYIDESSISYNAYTIAQHGRDEFGQTWPVYFRAFGDYKNPVYVYLLAAIYRVTGPGIFPARLLSATLGVLTALALGLLATRVSGRYDVGWLLVLMTLLTPWLFELSRVVLEVALYPLVIVLFLIAARRASTKIRWAWIDILSLAVTLALVTYTYSIGRMIGPLFALGIVFLASKERRSAVIAIWALYAASLAPLFIFQRSHPGALSGRFTLITYLQPPYSVAEYAWEFAKHYVGNFNPVRLLVSGDPNVEQIAHIHGQPLLLGVTGALALVGVFLIARNYRQDRWWWLVIYCLLVSVVPASLTKEYVHMLRLAPVPVFVLVLTIPAIKWLATIARRTNLTLLLTALLICLQGTLFVWKFHASANSKTRLRQFDNSYPEKIFAPALAMQQRPIYIADALAIPGYIQAYWYATLKGIDLSNFNRLPPDTSAPVGSLVISTEENCPRCQVIASSEFYTLYLQKDPAVERAALPDSAFRARLNLNDPPEVLPAGEHMDLLVAVKNESDIVWPARERSGGHLQVSAGNHWLDRDGRMLMHDDGRAALLSDLPPQKETQLKLTVNAPKKTGTYILEIDMLQEGVSWFALKGSPTLRVPVRVE
jgi:4-amino-4-deoxy-L-arabinose transferase-like glycosyltransferase